MVFHVKRRRSPVLQIISMIDILIILLIFLVVTSTFRELRPALNVSLPKSEHAATGSVTDARTVIAVGKDGKIQVAGQDTLPDALESALTSLKAGDPSAKFELQLDESSPLGTVVRVWDALAKSKIGVADVPMRVRRP